MVTIECTPGAVNASAMRVATPVRPVAHAFGAHLLLPTVRIHSLAGVGLYEVRGRELGWGGQWTDGKDAGFGIDPTSFPTRLGPPPDSPPVN